MEAQSFRTLADKAVHVKICLNALGAFIRYPWFQYMLTYGNIALIMNATDSLSYGKPFLNHSKFHNYI